MNITYNLSALEVQMNIRTIMRNKHTGGSRCVFYFLCKEVTHEINPNFNTST